MMHIQNTCRKKISDTIDDIYHHYNERVVYTLICLLLPSFYCSIIYSQSYKGC